MTGLESWVSHLLSVLSPGGVQALDEVGGVAEEHGVAGGAADHAQHGQPHVSQGLRGEPAVANTEHVGHRLAREITDQSWPEDEMENNEEGYLPTKYNLIR